MMTQDNAAKLALFPLLIAQALYVRRKALILPEPTGPRSGTKGQGTPLRLLIAGDSSGAGVGAVHQQQALSGHLSQTLSSDHTLTWQLEAKTGATSATTLDHLTKLPQQRFDVVVLALGVNDITRNVPLARWLETHRDLHDLLRAKFGTRLILASGIPPMHVFPLLPQPLRWVLGRTARRFDTALADIAGTTADVTHLPFDLPFEPKYIAQDGFHPSPAAYALWAATLARHIRNSPFPLGAS